MDSKLSNCPFCGSTPVFPAAADVFGTFYDCGCEECGIATMSIQIIDCFEHPRAHVHTSWNTTTLQYGLEFIEEVRRQAIEQWNTRDIPLEAIKTGVDLMSSTLALARHTMKPELVAATENQIAALQAFIAADQGQGEV